jgi:uncharacterized protein YceK
MAVRALRVALLLSSLPIAGCGTVVNLSKSHPEEGAKVPFGGVSQDVRCMQKAADGGGGCSTPAKSEAAQCRQAAVMLFCAADLPFSFLADVVTWPYTASYTYINQPIPVPPLTQAPPPPVIQAAAAEGRPQTSRPTDDGRPETSPLESLPQPRKVP